MGLKTLLTLLCSLLLVTPGWAAFTQTASCSNSVTGVGQTSVACSLTLTSGRLLVVSTTFEGADNANVQVTDGTNTYTGAASHRHANNDVEERFYYVLSHTASGSTTVTFSVTSGTFDYPRLGVYEASYADTAAFDVKNATDCPGGDPCTSGNITTTGSGSEFVIGHISDYVGAAMTSPQINSVAADGSVNPFVSGFDAMWFRVVSATFTGAATVNNGSAAGIGSVIAFKEVAGVGDVEGCYLMENNTDFYLMENNTDFYALEGGDGGLCGGGPPPTTHHGWYGPHGWF